LLNLGNKKGEFRIQHIIIAVLLTSLFGIMLFSMTSTFIIDHSNGTITTENLTSAGRGANRSTFYDSIEDLNTMSSELTDMGKLGAGGSESAASSEDSSAEGGLAKAGYSFVSNIGNWIYKYPKAIIVGTAGFFGIPSEFVSVAIAILISMVAIITASAVLKNRL